MHMALNFRRINDRQPPQPFDPCDSTTQIDPTTKTSDGDKDMPSPTAFTPAAKQISSTVLLFMHRWWYISRSTQRHYYWNRSNNSVKIRLLHKFGHEGWTLLLFKHHLEFTLFQPNNIHQFSLQSVHTRPCLLPPRQNHSTHTAAEQGGKGDLRRAIYERPRQRKSLAE
ncbi:unnamed protein product [Ectocarpus fasciculatus]